MGDEMVLAGGEELCDAVLVDRQRIVISQITAYAYEGGEVRVWTSEGRDTCWVVPGRDGELLLDYLDRRFRVYDLTGRRRMGRG